MTISEPECSKTVSELTGISVNSGNLPDIMYQLERPNAAEITASVPWLGDAQTNQPVINSDNQPLRYFSFLPRKLTSVVHDTVLVSNPFAPL